MYIEVTVDLKNYSNESFDIRLSNYHSVKTLIDIVWQARSISNLPREGYWVRVCNKKIVLSGNEKLVDCGITTGDRLEIL
ncbi:EsaB/YukD family protein [Cytobacillus purgationiresistens]|uniref:Ubiquitin-like protein YukD n=1 Tax=Cytobacillus purgationiresistens TaxID=863449 RepID=A0ABU0APV5_9BACI|nr:EsaB/YukD family protein [Cytobacillus purgationiresistens]MDQ0273314.1 putative ubiquitin-like protein YukD [Cytobacillus purgationiresistens]